MQMKQATDETLSPDMINTVADIARYRSAVAPNAVALSFDQKQTTYRELDIASNKVANGLIAHGVKAGDRVAVLDKNSDLFFEISLGVAKATAVLVPINFRLAAAEIAFIIRDAQVKVLFVGEPCRPLITEIYGALPELELVVITSNSYSWWRDGQLAEDPVLGAHADDVCVQLYTSGTTGIPKGVELTNRNLVQ